MDDYVAQHVQSAVFRFVHKQRVDGLVLNSGIRMFGNVEWQYEFQREFPHIPMVSIAKSVPGIPAVLVDNASGIAAAVDHLVVKHGRRLQAFIRGPSEADDSTIRYNAWISALAAHGIEADTDLVVQGDFATVSHPERLVDAWRRGRKFGAVIACSDLMAKDIIFVFRKSGIRVPEDVAVIGFDDEPSNRYADPPLTSVFQSVRDQARNAIDLLVAQWEGQTVAKETLLPTRVHIRASCGCTRAQWTVDPDVRDHLVEALAMPGMAGSALMDFTAKAENPSDCAFDVLTAIDALQADGTLNAIDLGEAQWNMNLPNFYLQSIGGFSHRPDQGDPALQVLDFFFDVAGAAINQEIVKVLASKLPKLGISRYCFSIIPIQEMERGGRVETEEGPQGGGDVNASVASGVVDFLPIARLPESPNEVENGLFNSTLLAPDDWMSCANQCALVILPIASRSTWFGLMVCEIAPGKEGLLLQLQGALVLACERNLLIRRNTRFSLAEWSRSLVIAEKSKTTGSLVLGVTQEISLPLSESTQAAATVRSQLETLQANFASGQLGRKNLSNTIAAMQPALALLGSNFSRIAKLVQTFKLVSVNEYGHSKESFDLVSDVRGLIRLLKPDLQARFIAVEMEAATPVPLEANRNVLREVLTGLVRNAMDHAFPPAIPVKPCITLSISSIEKTGEVQVLVRDNGVGVPKTLSDQIFQPFHSTKRSQGHVGLGLAIVRGLVTDALGGAISFLPNPLGGSTFKVRFPIAHPAQFLEHDST